MGSARNAGRERREVREAGGGWANFRGLPPRAAGAGAWPAIRPSGGRWSGQTMARRSAEPGTKFGAAFAGRGARPFISMQRRHEMNMQRGL